MFVWCIVCVPSNALRRCVCFFCQAEDGIRDLVRSRGLGDVYKRQGPVGGGDDFGRVRGVLQRVVVVIHAPFLDLANLFANLDHGVNEPVKLGQRLALRPVSYTHLTLPTSDLV